MTQAAAAVEKAIRHMRVNAAMRYTTGRPWRVNGVLHLPRQTDNYDGSERHVAIVAGLACRVFGWSWQQMVHGDPDRRLRGLSIDRKCAAVVCKRRTAATGKDISAFFGLCSNTANVYSSRLAKHPDPLWEWRMALLSAALDDVESSGKIAHKIAGESVLSGLAPSGGGIMQPPEMPEIVGGLYR